MYLAICENQTEELAQLTALLHTWQEKCHIPVRIKTFENALTLLEAAKKEPFTLYLLDIMMPGINGISAAKEIRSFDETATIIFLSSSPSFAYESYSVQAMQYLLKPITAKLLFPILDQLALLEQKPEEGITLKAGADLYAFPFPNFLM